MWEDYGPQMEGSSYHLIKILKKKKDKIDPFNFKNIHKLPNPEGLCANNK